MKNPTRLLPLFFVLLASSPAIAASTADLLEQGRWLDAATQAEKEGDYLTAGYALNLQMQCPSPSQPNGQNWSVAIATRGVDVSRKAVAQFNTGAKGADAYTNLGSHLGLIANAMLYSAAANFPEILRYTKESKSSYDKAMQLNPNDTLAVANLATFHAKTYKVGGIAFGATKTDAQLLIGQAVKLFNASPNVTREQQIQKALDAVRIGTAMEGVSDKRNKAIFEAAIKLGEAAGGARGLCAANLGRVHLGQPITRYY